MIQLELKRFYCIKNKNNGLEKKSLRIIYFGAKSHIFADIQKDYLRACVCESV